MSYDAMDGHDRDAEGQRPVFVLGHPVFGTGALLALWVDRFVG